jgi:hypothetical protein
VSDTAERLTEIEKAIQAIDTKLGNGEYRGALAAIRENTRVTIEHTTMLAVMQEREQRLLKTSEDIFLELERHQQILTADRLSTCPVAPGIAAQISAAVGSAMSQYTQKNRMFRLKLWGAVLATATVLTGLFTALTQAGLWERIGG